MGITIQISMSPSCLKLLLTLTLVFIICECAPQGRPGKARAKGGVKECTDDSDCDEGFNCIFGKKINKHICARLGLKKGKGPKGPKGKNATKKMKMKMVPKLSHQMKLRKKTKLQLKNLNLSLQLIHMMLLTIMMKPKMT